MNFSIESDKVTVSESHLLYYLYREKISSYSIIMHLTVTDRHFSTTPLMKSIDFIERKRMGSCILKRDCSDFVAGFHAQSSQNQKGNRVMAINILVPFRANTVVGSHAKSRKSFKFLKSFLKSFEFG